MVNRCLKGHANSGPSAPARGLNPRRRLQPKEQNRFLQGSYRADRSGGQLPFNFLRGARERFPCTDHHLNNPSPRVVFRTETKPGDSGGHPEAGAVAQIVNWRPDRIAIETSADRSGVLDLHMTAYPGWIAELDGREVPLTRAPPLFMAVKVPAGRHHFVLRYAPFSLANLTDALRRAAGWQPDTDISSSRPPPAAAFTLH
jgi:hypothetical protein